MFSQKVIGAIERVRKEASLIDCAKLDYIISNLVFVYQIVVASESLLEEAVRVSEGELRDYFVSHLEEERSHEEWLAADLRTCGIDVKQMPLLQKAVEIAGSQYYLIKHVDPACLLGYMAVLEGFPVSSDSLEKLEQMHGKELFRTLRYHSEHDLDHRKELFDMIDKFPSERILTNAVQTALYFNEFAEALNQE